MNYNTGTQIGPDLMAKAKYFGWAGYRREPVPEPPKPVTELPLKVWVERQAGKEGRTKSAIHMRLSRGKYPDLKLRRVNSRVVYVLV